MMAKDKFTDSLPKHVEEDESALVKDTETPFLLIPSGVHNPNGFKATYLMWRYSLDAFFEFIGGFFTFVLLIIYFIYNFLRKPFKKD